MSKNLNILVVDDDPVICKVISESLVPKGYHVMLAKDGVEALKLVDSLHETIDILLTDVIMPRMNGSELSRVIQSWHPKIKVILMSGYPEEDLVRFDIAGSNVTYIRKPFAQNVLLQAVEDVLGE